MLIDTHAHIYLDQFDDDLEDVIGRAREAGVERIVMPAIDISSIERAIHLCDRHEGLSAMAALHPSEVKSATEADLSRVAELCRHQYVVAVGETGLDFHWDRTFDDKQLDYLRQHIRLAVECDLPVVFHNRNATEDLLKIVEEERTACADPDRMRGIFHCFTGTPAESERMWSLGFYVGIGGIVTFKNADLAAAVQAIPLDRMVLETDSPYLAPHPHRGKRNEPSFMLRVAEKVAEVHGVSLERVAEETTANAESIFGLDQPPERRSPGRMKSSGASTA